MVAITSEVMFAPQGGATLQGKEDAMEAQNTVGELLRRWRKTRRMSQLDLAGDAEVSTRHISYLENGRSRPSREMLLVLASAMEVPLRERNTMLAAAGFAPAYRETDLDDPEVAHIVKAMRFLLDQAAPYGAAAVDRSWRLIEANAPMQRILSFLLGPGWDRPEVNLIKLTFEAGGLRPFIVNFTDVAAELLSRLHSENTTDPDPARVELMRELLVLPGIEAIWRTCRGMDKPALLVPFHLRKDGMEARLFTTITTLGTPTDITLQELRIESYFPADEASDALMRALGSDG